jgi:F-type H+-transporting ATPase subunit delta
MTRGMVSRRYAEGLFAAAKAADAMDTIGKDLYTICQAVEASSDLKAALYHPQVTRDEKKTLIDLILGEQVSHLTLNLMHLMIDKRRMDILPGLIEDYNFLVREERNEAIAHVQAARPLSPDNRNKLERNLSKRTGKRITLSVKVNPELIGGLIVEIDGRIIDGSIKGRLDNLMENISAMGPQWSAGIEVNNANEVTT